MSTNNINTLSVSLIDVLKAVQMILTSANMEQMQIARILDKIYEEASGFSALEAADIAPKKNTSNAWCTPAQIGALCEPQLSAIMVDHLLQIGGYQMLVSSVYEPLPKAEGLYQWRHDGRFYATGRPITEILWSPEVANIVQELAKQHNSTT